MNSLKSSLANSALLGQEFKKNDRSQSVKSLDKILNHSEKGEAKSSESGLLRLISKITDDIQNQKLPTNLANLKFSTSLVKDFVKLHKLIKNDVKFAEFRPAIEQFFKGISLKDANALKNALINSGVMLEARLRLALSQTVLPSSFYELISKMKNLKNTSLKEEIFSLGDEEMPANESLEKLSEFLHSLLASKDAKSKGARVFALFSFLQNALKFAHKNEEKLKNNQEKFERFLQKIDKKIQKECPALIFVESKQDNKKSVLKALNSYENALQKISSYKAKKSQAALNLKNAFDSKDFAKIKMAVKELKNECEFKAFAYSQTDFLGFKNALKRLANSINLLSSKEENFTNSSKKAEAKSLLTAIKNAEKDLANIKEQNLSECIKELKNDAKALLLRLNFAANSSGDEAVANLSERMLAQIEINQLMSAQNKEINTFMPYEFANLSEAQVSIKSQSDDLFSAQISLKIANIGEINVLLNLENKKYLDINIRTNNANFNQELIHNAKEFKADLRKINLMCANFFIGLLPKDYGSDIAVGLGFDKRI